MPIKGLLRCHYSSSVDCLKKNHRFENREAWIIELCWVKSAARLVDMKEGPTVKDLWDTRHKEVVKCCENTAHRIPALYHSQPTAQTFRSRRRAEETSSHSPQQCLFFSFLRHSVPEADHRNASCCQEAVKCWCLGQWALTHMWLYFHKSILIFLLPPSFWGILLMWRTAMELVQST